jgi:hypothetical protein
MNSRLLVKSLLFLIGIASAIMPVALHAALPPAAQTAKENADDAANPYSVIVERNIFHLNPPPPPVDPNQVKIELPVVKITGFINIGSVSKVLFVSQPKDKKEGPIYYSLTESEKSGDGKLELVKIHDSKDAVDVINAGTLVTLTVKDDSLLPATDAPAAPAARGGTPAANPGHGMPGRPRFEPGNRNFQPGAEGNGLPARMRRTQQ